MKEDQREKVLARLRKKLDANPKSRSKAIDLLCCQCIFDPMAMGSGGWRSQVGACLNTTCGVYNLRPMPTGGYDEDDEDEPQTEAILTNEEK